MTGHPESSELPSTEDTRADRRDLGASLGLAPPSIAQESPLSTVIASPKPRGYDGEQPRLPSLRVHQLLVLCKAWRRISTHHITLGMALIGGQHATLSVSLLPAE